MKKIAAIISAILAIAATAHAQTGSVKTAPQLNAEVNQLWPDQTQGTITPFGARQTLLDIIASAPTLGLFSATPKGDLNYQILMSDRYLYPSATLTAPRVWTLPAASSYPAGLPLVVQDALGNISGANTLTLALTGSDHYIGAASPPVLNAQFQWFTLYSDGVSNWGSALTGTNNIIANAVSNAKLAQAGAATLKMNATAGTANSTDTKVSALTDITTPSTTLDWLPIEDHLTNTIKKTNAAELVAAIGGGVTSVTCGPGLTGGTITSTGACAVGGTPAGRLTLVSGQAEMTTDVIGSQNVFYAPASGTTVPVLVSGADTTKTFTSSATDQVGLTLALAGNAAWPAATLFDVFAVVDSGVTKLATRQWDAGMLPTEPQITNATTITTGTAGSAWTNPANAFNGTVNQTSANSAVNTTSNTGLSNCLGQDWGVGVTKIVSKVLLTAPTDNPLRGDAPTSLQIEVDASNDNSNWRRIDIRNINASTNNTTYTIPINKMKINPGSASRYHRVCLSGNAANAIRVSQIQFLNIVAPSAGRRLMKYNGRLTNDATVPTMRTGAGTTISTAINEGTFLGVFQTDPATNGQVSFTFEFGASRMLNLWNAYNPRTVTVAAGIPTVAPYSYNITTPANIDWGPMQATTTFSVQVVSGYAFETTTASLIRPAYIQASAANAGYEAGIGVDTTLGFSGTEFSTTLDTSGQNLGLQGSASVTLPPYFGTHTFFGVEKAAYTLPGIIAVFTDIQNTGISLTTRY